MKTYLFVQKDYSKFLELKDNKEETHWAINHLDLSNEPFIFEIFAETETNFTLQSNIFNLNAKKFFNLTSVGNGLLTFQKQPKQISK